MASCCRPRWPASSPSWDWFRLSAKDARHRHHHGGRGYAANRDHLQAEPDGDRLPDAPGDDRQPDAPAGVRQRGGDHHAEPDDDHHAVRGGGRPQAGPDDDHPRVGLDRYARRKRALHGPAGCEPDHWCAVPIPCGHAHCARADPGSDRHATARHCCGCCWDGPDRRGPRRRQSGPCGHARRAAHPARLRRACAKAQAGVRPAWQNPRAALCGISLTPVSFSMSLR